MNSRWEFQSICICISVSQGAGVSRLGGWAAWPQHRHYTPTLDTGHRPHQCTQGNNEDKLHSMHQYIYYTCLGVIYWVCPHTPPFFPIVQWQFGADLAFGIQLMIAIAKNCCKLWHKHEEMGVILRYLIDYICGRIFSERARELFAHSPVISCLYLLLLLY